MKILKIGTPEFITVIVQKQKSARVHSKDAGRSVNGNMVGLIRLLLQEQSDLGLHYLLRPTCPSI